MLLNVENWLLVISLLNIAAPGSNNTKLPSNQTCALSLFECWKDVSTLEFVLYERCINVRIRFIWKLIVYSLFVLDFIIFEKLSRLWKNRCKSTNFKTSQVKPPYPQNVTVMFSVPKLIYKWPLVFSRCFWKRFSFILSQKVNHICLTQIISLSIIQVINGK